MRLRYRNFETVLGESARIAETAAVIGRLAAGAGLTLRAYATLRADGEHIRAAAGVNQVPCLTTAAAGLAAAEGIADWAHHELRVRSLQEYHEGRDADQPSLPL